MSDKTRLKMLQEANARFNAAWLKKKGHKLTSYKCPDCGKKIAICQPKKADVDERGFWDSLRSCIYCGTLTFIKVFPNGQVESNAQKEAGSKPARRRAVKS